MNVLVLGGTTFFGRRLVQKLLAGGHQVAILTRGRHPTDLSGLAEHFTGDRKDYEGFFNLFRKRQFDFVFDNIAFDEADVACALRTFAGNIGHYLVCSSEAVYADRNSRLSLLREEEADLAVVVGEAYSDGKRALERMLFAQKAGEQTFPFTILRPTVVEGPRDPTWRTWYWLQRVLDGGELLLPLTSPEMIGRFVYADDVADAYILAAGKSVAFNKAYNIAGDNVFTLEDYIRVIATILGREAVWAYAAYGSIRQEPGLHDFTAEYAGARYMPDNARARNDLAFRPRRIQEWMVETIAWLVQDDQKKDSAGYDQRRFEIAAAKKILGINPY
jgi:2'-hydroxyisoflavone reductase